MSGAPLNGQPPTLFDNYLYIIETLHVGRQALLQSYYSPTSYDNTPTTLLSVPHKNTTPKARAPQAVTITPAPNDDSFFAPSSTAQGHLEVSRRYRFRPHPFPQGR